MTADGSIPEPVAKCVRRRWLRVASIAVVVVCVLPLLWWWGTRPFRVAKQFVGYIDSKQYDKATAMLSPDDQQSIPPGFWEQFNTTNERMTLSAPGPWTFVGGGMALTFAFKDTHDNFYGGCGIRFAVMPTTVKIAEITFRSNN